jgi:hypothetical protein
MNAPDKALPPAEPRLTSLSHGGGCGCKIAPGVLSEILKGTAAMPIPKELMVGIETADDAAVYRLNDEQALIATTDFFMPIVDDPLDFGRIAATNAISDVYAMGGRPILALALVTNVFTLRIRRLPVGRAWEALREDEIACRSLGINPTNTKLSAFAIGAMFAGFAGAFFSARQGFVSPESFTYIESAVILAIVVLGGMGSQIGVVVAAAFLILIPEFGRDFAQYRMLLFGLAMVLVMIWRPQGLVSGREPSVRLHAERR